MALQFRYAAKYTLYHVCSTVIINSIHVVKGKLHLPESYVVQLGYYFLFPPEV